MVDSPKTMEVSCSLAQEQRKLQSLQSSLAGHSLSYLHQLL